VFHASCAALTLICAVSAVKGGNGGLASFLVVAIIHTGFGYIQDKEVFKFGKSFTGANG
jgi:hypothetical protein